MTIGSIASTIPVAQADAAITLAKVGHLRFLVQAPADAVADEIAHHGEPVALDAFLDGSRDIAQAVADLHLFDACP